METKDTTEVESKRAKRSKLQRLEALNWQKVQVVGTLFADSLESGMLTEDDLTSLVQLTGKLLEFVAEAREIVFDDTNSLHLAS